MILGLQLYGPIACGKMDLVEMLKGIRKVGIDRIEPCIDLDGKMTNPSFWSMEKLDELFPVIKEIGLEIISCHVAAENLNESILKLCQLADKYGIKHIVVGTGALTEEAIQEKAFLYRKIADILAEHNAELLLHNGKGDIAKKIQGRTAYEYMVDICQGKVGMQFDTGWCARGGVDPWNFIKMNGHRIKSLHYKDFNMNKDTDVDVCIGDGTLDNEIFMQFGRYTGIPQFIDADTYSDVIADASKSYWYLMNIGQYRNHTVSYLNIYDTYTGTVKTIQKFDGVVEAPSYLHGWSPDGKELAYCAFRQIDGQQHVDIYTIPAEGGEEKRLTKEGFNDGPEYSPDGKQVVNLAYRAGDSHPGEHLPNMQVELWMMDYNGTNRRRILEFFGGQGSINVNSWSGDSRYFAFVSYDIQRK